MSEVITSRQVIDKIEELRKPDGVLSEDEIKTVDYFYDRIKTREGKKEVKEYINSKLQGKTQTDLKKLIEEFEKQANYGMEYLKENSNSKFFNIILGNDISRLYYSSGFVGDKIKGNEKLFGDRKTIDLVYWNKIVKELGIASTGKYAMDNVGNFFKGILGKFSSVGDKVKESTSGEFDISKMGDIFTDLGKMGDFDNLSKKQSENLKGTIGKISGYLDFLTKGYTENLNKLIELGKNDKAGLQKLLDNPMVLNQVLESGKYNADGYNIDLKSNKVVFNSNPDLSKSKKEFLKIVTDETNGSGNALDSIKDKSKELIGVFKGLGFDSNTLKEFREGLKEIPIIGEFLATLAGFFLSNKLLNMMEGNPWNKEYKKVGKNLEIYMKSNKDNLPFKFDEKTFESERNIGIVEGFLDEFDYSDKKEKRINLENKGKEVKDFDIKGSINEETFWKELYSTEKSSNSTLEQYRLKVQEIKKSDKDISFKDFFNKLRKVEVGFTDKKVKTPDNKVKKEEVKTEGTNATVVTPEVKKEEQPLSKEKKEVKQIPVEKKLDIKQGDISKTKEQIVKTEINKQETEVQEEKKNQGINQIPIKKEEEQTQVQEEKKEVKQIPVEKKVDVKQGDTSEIKKQTVKTEVDKQETQVQEEKKDSEQVEVKKDEVTPVTPIAKEVTKKVSFKDLLNSPKQITENKIVLSDSSEIVYNEKSREFSLNGEKFGVDLENMKLLDKINLKITLKQDGRSLNFQEIYSNNSEKSDLIKVFNDLKSIGKTTYLYKGIPVKFKKV